MNLKLKRLSYTADGIFGLLLDEQGNLLAYTLTHAYPAEDGGGFAPKVPAGVYKCVRGMHRLSHMAHPFETFEITGVSGHSNILFHCGNTQADSEGCELLGTKIEGTSILESRAAFARFLEVTKDVQEFQLEVS